MISNIKTSFIAATLAFFAAAVSAAPVNLFTNGSFENGLSGWTLGNGSSAPSVVNYAAGTPASTASNVSSNSPDTVGLNGLFYRGEGSTSKIGQQVYLKAGRYLVGFDGFSTAAGYSSPGEAIASISNGIPTSGVSADGTSWAGIDAYAVFLASEAGRANWGNYSEEMNIATDGYYDISLVVSMNPNSKDIVLDRAFLIALDEAVANNVPEPGSLALMGLGLAGLVAVRKRKSNAAKA